MFWPSRYCEYTYKSVRRPTRTINIGNVLVGSEHPIALQVCQSNYLAVCELRYDSYRQARYGCNTMGTGIQMHWVLAQTMTTTDTRNVQATVDQVKKCADAGADMVRITVQGKREAQACHAIREQLFKDR